MERKNLQSKEIRNFILTQSFYARDTEVVAFELIGKILVLKRGGITLSGKIVETEAYLAHLDPASHAHRGETPRNRVMFGISGKSYVYFTYGFHHCFNVVTEKEGIAGAVLIRALEPLQGIKVMEKRRGLTRKIDLTNGPGKLTQAFGLTRQDSGLDLTESNFYIENSNDPDFMEIGVSSRIGIREAVHFPYRFFLKDSPFVSKFIAVRRSLHPPKSLFNSEISWHTIRKSSNKSNL